MKPISSFLISVIFLADRVRSQSGFVDIRSWRRSFGVLDRTKKAQEGESDCTVGVIDSRDDSYSVEILQGLLVETPVNLHDGPIRVDQEEDALAELTSGGGTTCLRKKCTRTIQSLSGMVVNGSFSGLLSIDYADGTTLRASARSSRLDSLYEEAFSRDEIVEIGRFKWGTKVGPVWIFDDHFQTALYLRETAATYTTTFGCLFDLEHATAACGSIANFSLSDGRVCRKVASIVELDVLHVKCNSFDDSARRLHFRPGDHLHHRNDLIKSQSVWFRLRNTPRPRPKRVFISENVSSVEQLRNVSVRLTSTVGVGPARCRYQKLDLWQLPEDSVFEHAAVSYPGSGSKWVFQMISLATGILDYYLWLEHEATYFRQSALLIKSHHQRAANYQRIVYGQLRASEDLNWRLHHVERFQGRGVMLLRNPYEAILAHWNHAQAGEFSVNHDMVKSLRSDKFLAFANIEIDLWFEIIADWLTVAPDILIVHFENFKLNSTAELLKVLKHFNLEPDPDRIDCLSKIKLENHKRIGKPPVPENAFSQNIRQRFDTTIRKADELLQEFGHHRLPLGLYKFYRNPS